MLFAAVHESASGPKRTSLVGMQKSALGGKADMAIAVCLLLTESQNFSSRPVLLFFEKGLGALRQFRWCNIFLMRCNVPTVSERVRDSTAAVTVEHIRRVHNFCAAGF